MAAYQNGSAIVRLSPRQAREAKHEVLLFFVELLMECKSRKLHDLSCLFGSPNFTPEMKQVVGASQTGLKRFLLKHPSLFTIKGDTVTMTSYDVEDNVWTENGHGKEQYNSTGGKAAVSPEDEAVEFFRSKLLAAPARDEYRLPLRSLVGHRSQAPEKIRSVMGRNLPDFIRFLRAHSDVFLYDVVSDTVKLTPSAQKSPSRDCPSPSSSISSFSSVSLPAGEFDPNECLEFIALVLQTRGPLFLDELYGHLNKKYKPDVRQHFAKNPRELGEMLQQRGGNRFQVAGNLVTYVGLPSPQETAAGGGGGSVRSPPGSAREGMKLRLAQTLNKVMTDNKARGALPEPEMDKVWIPPWTEVIKPKQLKALVSEILDSSAGADAVGLSFILGNYPEVEPEISENGLQPITPRVNFKLSKIFLATYDGKIHLISILEHPELLRLGGLKELLTSDKIRKVFHDGSKGLAALINQYGLRIVNPFDTQVGYSILEYQNSSGGENSQPFLESDRSISVLDVAGGCMPSAVRMANTAIRPDPDDAHLCTAYNSLRIVFPQVYEALKSRMSMKFLPLMRTILEEQYEEYLNPERAKLLIKNRRTLHQLDVLQSKLNHHRPADVGENGLSEEETRLREMVTLTSNSHGNTTPIVSSESCVTKGEMATSETQTAITGDIRPIVCDEFYDDNLGIIRNRFPHETLLAISDMVCDTNLKLSTVDIL
ncbi:egalitarian protein homolog [Paramacrobiotus metropolitanus]|uniref:egalitarian protein homolog n=1 Tax=Paramacrobiotus metropolitanus TaxID=2943436 RepID=UPI002445DF89|nr:egalitarian protein homolog [Paramacrobiotus metropolitanus]